MTMRILAIDTSDSFARWVGVTENGPLDPVETQQERKHDERLAAGVNKWLIEHEWDQIDAVAVVVGPGGFTGLRVGVAFATGFAMAKGIPVLPVSSYEMLAARASEGETVWALAFTGRGEIRGQVMRGGRNPEPLDDVRVFPVDSPEMKVEGKVLPLGIGYKKHPKEIEAFLSDRLVENATLNTEVNALAFASLNAWNLGRKSSPLDIDVDYGADFMPTRKGEK